MQFNRHPKLEGLHAPFSPSQSYWLRYNDEKTMSVYLNQKAKDRGTRLHAWAKETIDLGIKQPRSEKTLYKYVNDAIGFKMDTEVVLYYSDVIFGTADAICFRKDPKDPDGRYILRIHDLKTGVTKVDMEQLEIYAALFCLEYKIKPSDINIELRIYQNDTVLYHEPSAEDIDAIMQHIIRTTNICEKIDSEEV